MNPSGILEEKIVISNTVEGTLNIPLTSKYLSRGIRLVAYSKRKLTYASPENLLLKAFYLRLYRDIEQLKDKLVGLGYDKSRVLELYAKKLMDNIEAFTKRLNKVGRLSILKEIVVEPRLLKCNELRHLAKVVLRRRHKLYHEIARQAIAVAITRKRNKWIDTYLAIIEITSKPYIDYNTRLWDEPAKRYWSPHPYVKPQPVTFYYPVRIKFKTIKTLGEEGIPTTIIGVTPTQEDSIYGKSIYLLKDNIATIILRKLHALQT